MKNIKNIKNNNYYIIFGLIVLFLVVLNYNNLINFFKIKEGAENKEKTKESIEEEIVNAYQDFLTQEQNESTNKVTFVELLSNTVFKENLTDLFNLHIELFLKQNNKTYSEYLEDLKNSEYTYPEFKVLFKNTLPYLAQMGITFKVYQDLRFNLLNEMENFTIPSADSVKNDMDMSSKGASIVSKENSVNLM